ncbi:UDP-glucose/GDP-mannose dehydrogenase family protein [Nocardioides sp. HDW12B]|uniref:UDP-glucose dehydrogenase family protein n=1 Tax=Nocardioides sp. HDW12B TaxID=2714939 RepID=UPI0014085758|nr:UDP-glucose/GDP-mannose dehydrogenase family protein [Nocardioides sp. HDW12B]QIK64944.1 UDP-glucose/GDP-mannose dehydrogenase family protein [Nocardioides sp. HDW12B]
MKIGVIGCGYLGAVHAACMTKLGHDVVGYDVDEAKIESLSAGKAPFYEPGLDELLAESLATGRLSFTLDPAELADATAYFVCVGTPQKRNENAADMTFVDAAVTTLIPQLSDGDVVIGKSTVPVGTAERLLAQIEEAVPGATLCWNPEFLREGFAVEDTLTPDRLVFGLPVGDGAEPSERVLREVYTSVLDLGTPLVVTDLGTAQLVKVAANSFLATKISFINAMAEFCEATGSDVVAIADAIGFDERIGRKFLNAGLGFGGGCLPKDIRAFMARAGELGVDQTLTFLREVDSINMRRRTRMVDLAREECGGSIAGRRIAVLGASFKPNSDDVRDSPALNVAEQMRLQGADVTVTDPIAVENARGRFPDLRFVSSVEEAIAGVDLVLLLTEWKEYVELDPDALKPLVGQARVLDGRNALDPARWRAAGWTYRALGRSRA